jgi:hypothetical protein
MGTVAASVAVAAAVMALPAGAAAAGPTVSVSAIPIVFKGTVNLSSSGFSARRSGLGLFRQGSSLAGARAGGSIRIIDQAIVDHRLAAGSPLASTAFPVTTAQVRGESGFSGLNGYQQAVVNNDVDLEPPDQGLCAGNGYVGEFINNAFAVYDPNGIQLLNTVPSYALFKQPSTAFMSDPRCYFDQATQRWFLTEFVVGNGSGTVPSTQFITVSNTPDPLGSWSVWAINTTDKGALGCPCFGDFDQLGADNNGVYITTNEFGTVNPVFNGVIIYAVSKQLLEQFRNTGIKPTLFRYRVTADQFGQPYHISPASSPPGATFAPETEYFVESNSDAFSDNHLLVYALQETSLLAQPAPPLLVNTRVTTQPYSFPPVGQQKAGPIPLGNANQGPEGVLQSDFNAIQEVTYNNGHLLAEASTTSKDGNVGAAWFDLVPHNNGGSAHVAHQGVVGVAGQSLLYPVIAVNSAGAGYMGFTLTGPNYFPSAAYQTFTTTGPSGPVRIAAAGAVPEDGFTCYAALVGPFYGGCRWGDYSMGVAMGSDIFLATEYVPPSSRDYLTNWGTFVWQAPATP